jgi:threonine/homoserine/homoserine lactone efflux protein
VPETDLAVASLLVQVAFYGIAAAIAAPVAAVVTSLILDKSKRPVASAWIFTAGAAFLDVAFAVVLLASGAFDNGGDAGAYVDVGLGVLFAMLGILALFEKQDPQKDEAKRQRVEGLASAKLTRLFATGIIVQVINFDAIAVFGGALKEIAQADVTTREEIFATLFGLALMLSVYYGPAVLYSVVPERAGPILRGMTEWILRNSRMVEIVIGLGFGAMFLYKGLSVLV